MPFKKTCAGRSPHSLVSGSATAATIAFLKENHQQFYVFKNESSLDKLSHAKTHNTTQNNNNCVRILINGHDGYSLH